MKKFLKKYTFTIIFCTINIIALAFGFIWPAEEDIHWFLYIAHAPAFLMQEFLDIVCQVDSAIGMAYYEACDNLPDLIEAPLFFLYLFLVIGSIGFLTVIGMMIDFLKKKL